MQGVSKCVANRVQQIRDRTLPSQWKYVGSQINPADDASRGQNAKDLIENSRWWNGPDFLWKPLEDQRLLDDVAYIFPDDPEERKILTMATQTEERFTLPDRLKYFSSWYRAKRAVAVCLPFQRSFQTGSSEETQVKTEDVCTSVPMTTHGAHSARSKQFKMNQYVPVNTQELQNAEMEILKAVQREVFKEEISLLCSVDAQGSQDRNTFRSIKKSSTLYRLDPFLDKNGTFRVGGRLKHADLTTAEKHPVVLPKKGHVTGLIISHYHDSIEHQGRGRTFNRI